MSAQPHAGTYRADIDGLRAIAVLSVMGFHAGASVLPGGFVGVDIFFVISGYLISRQIASGVSNGDFSLLEFYRRRIRRIMPAMLLVIGVTLLAAALVLTPRDGRDVAKSAVWSLASLANLHFWRDIDTDYFANSSAELPLLHLWSLGVEEQFYLIWPLLLVLGLRWLRPPLLLGVIAAVGGLSFALASRSLAHDPLFAFYMLPPRAGELLIGGLLGVAVATTTWRPDTRSCRLAAGSGAMLLVASLVTITPAQAFPGWSALPPTLGAALLILAGEGGGRPVRWLAVPPLVFVGRISYSAYLWHWPLFAFFRYGYGEPGALTGTVIIVLALLLAWAGFEWVERPARRSTAPLARLALTQFAVPAAVLLLASLTVIYADRLGLQLAPSDYQAQAERVREAYRPSHQVEGICQRQHLSATDLSDPRCVHGGAGSGSARVLFWGDSNAAHYVPMVNLIAAQAGARVRNVSVGSCPPIFGDPGPYVPAYRAAICRPAAALIADAARHYPVLMIAADWAWYRSRSDKLGDDLAELLSGLTAAGHRVVLIGKAPNLERMDRHCAERALRFPLKTCADSSQALGADVLQVNAELRGLAGRWPGVSYFDANAYLCPDGVCRQHLPDGRPRFIDINHLSVAGSAELGRQVLAADGVPAAFSALLAGAQADSGR